MVYVPSAFNGILTVPLFPLIVPFLTPCDTLFLNTSYVNVFILTVLDTVPVIVCPFVHIPPVVSLLNPNIGPGTFITVILLVAVVSFPASSFAVYVIT